MEYREFGKTGKRVSRFGLGAMRLPQKEGRVDFDAAGELIRHALRRGVNFIDTAYVYTDSEDAIGRATCDLDRSTFYIQTKCPLNVEDKPGDVRRYLEGSLKRLRTDYIDFYLAHDARAERAGEPLRRFLDEARRARDEGLVTHIGFSSHDDPAAVLRLIDSGEFDCMLVQYSLLDTNYTVPISHGHMRGLGVSVMGPLAGGKLVTPGEMTRLLASDEEKGVRPALRFVFSNQDIDVALSGVSTIEQLDEDIEIASNLAPLTDEEQRQIERAIFEKRQLAEIYCTACGYCMPCPNSVNIPEILRLAQYVRLYDLRDWAAETYRVQLRLGQGADQCFRCGECESKCPQGLPIQTLLAESHVLLGGEEPR